MSAKEAKKKRLSAQSPPREMTQMMDLSDEMIEFIAKLLDRGSFRRFAITHTRIRRICENSVYFKQTKARTVDVDLVLFISLDRAGVRVLDLSHCWSDPEIIETLITECVGLTTLNVVNSAVQFHRMARILKALKNLEDVNLTVTACDWRTTFAAHQSIRKIYVEFAPNNQEMKYAIEFLESCPAAKSLHIHLIGRSRSEVHQGEPYNMRADLADNYQAVVITTNMRESCSRSFAVTQIFGGTRLRDHLLETHVSTDDFWWFDAEHTEGERYSGRGRGPALLNHLYETLVLPEEEICEIPRAYRAGQFGLRVEYPKLGADIKMPSMEAFSSLVELDVTMCHIDFHAESWISLSSSSPELRALAVPACCFFPLPVDNEKIEIDGILEAMTMPELRKFRIEGDLGSPNIQGCARCEVAVLPLDVMDYIGKLHCLEELTLNEVQVEPGFLFFANEPFNMTTVRLNFHSSPSWEMLDEFLQQCDRLNYLKLCDPSLTLSPSTLWGAVRDLDLKQLCVSGAASRFASDLPNLAPRALAAHIEVVHFHELAPEPTPERENFFLFLRDSRKIETPEGNTGIRFIDDGGCREVSFPGRNLCFSECYTARVKPVGWEVD